MVQMGWAIMAKWVIVFGRYARKHWSSGQYPFRSSHDHGFRSLLLPICGLLQKGQEHSPPKVHFEESSFCLANLILQDGSSLIPRISPRMHEQSTASDAKQGRAREWS